MKAFSTSIQIKATPQKIWDILTDAPRWTQWNTTITRIDGAIVAGGKVTVHTKLSPGRAFAVNVTEFAPPHRMVWTGGMPLGLFQGVRTFLLIPRPSNTVEFSMREVFSGLMSPLILKSIPDLEPSFIEFGEALKKRSETK